MRGNNANRYLPPLDSEIRNGTVFKQQWKNRFDLAHFKNIFKPVIDDAVGLMQKNPAKIEFEVNEDENLTPQEVKDIAVYGNVDNDGLNGLKRRLNRDQLLYGRAGLLLDVASENGFSPAFVIREYPANTILDGEIQTDARGRETLLWVLLAENGVYFDRKTKEWKHDRLRVRVLFLNHGTYSTCVLEGGSAEVEKQWRDFDFDTPPPETVTPTFKGTTLDEIPFTVCNASRLGLNNWQLPPFYDVAIAAISRYQTNSIYKLGLYRHASPTVVVLNAEPNKEITLGSMLTLQSEPNMPASVTILETTGSGLAEIRNALEDDESCLESVSLRTLLDGAGANSSGKAIEMRTASGTAVIASVDQCGALAIEEQLVYAAIWAGATREHAGERITFNADTSYLGADYTLAEVTNFITANAQTNVLSRTNTYSVLASKMPEVISSFEDNEIQLEMGQ